MKILYAASEATPFAKSGGLADVAGSLPKALVKDGVDARVIMPLYGDLKMRDKLEYVTNYSVPVGWRSQYCGLFKAEVNGVTYYFLDNEYYFKRRGLYGFYDDGERFAFFSRAVLETLFYIDFTPDIINCNDWQTALVPVYLNLYYRHLDKFNRIKTIFTIHNIAYQGKYGTDILEDTCGIGHRDQHIVEYDGCANFMKGAFETADKITTVSPTYAQEILDPWFSYGLDALLREKQYKLCGILNGIDMEANNPATDPKIPFNYDVTNFEEGKAKCKEALQDKFGLHKDGSPVFAMVSRMVGMKGFDLVQSVADGLVDRGIELVILGSGENQYETFFSDRDVHCILPQFRFCLILSRFSPAEKRAGRFSLQMLPDCAMLRGKRGIFSYENSIDHCRKRFQRRRRHSGRHQDHDRQRRIFVVRGATVIVGE